MAYHNLRIGDRVAQRGTGREGIVENLTSSPGWVDQAKVAWDDGAQDETMLDWPPTGSLIRIEG